MQQEQALVDGWRCACGEWTTVTHWRSGADGAMFHAGPDAPPSDPSPVENGYAPNVREGRKATP